MSEHATPIVISEEAKSLLKNLGKPMISGPDNSGIWTDDPAATGDEILNHVRDRDPTHEFTRYDRAHEVHEGLKRDTLIVTVYPRNTEPNPHIFS